MAEIKDQFPNQAYLTVTESGANTLTFNQLLTGVSIYEKIGWIIHRMEYLVDLTAAGFAAATDLVTFGLSVSDQISAVGLQYSACVDYQKIERTDLGVAASGQFVQTPVVKDYSTLPGGGLMVPPNPIFLYVKGSNAPNPFTIRARMFYTVKSLKVEDYWELVEIRRMIGA